MVKKNRQSRFFASWVFKEFIVEYIFKEFLRMIKNDVKNIDLVPKLRHPDTAKVLYGYTEIDGENKFDIYLNESLKKEKPLKTFIHELAHCLLAKIGKNIYPIIEEIRVLQAEKLLYECFSEKQKKRLRRFLPKIVSGRKPMGLR